MTRYEALEFDLFAYNGDMTFINADDVVIQIHNIFDDFESRTCENCGQWDLSKSKNNIVGKCVRNNWGIKNTPSNFGCNKFEREVL